MTTKFRPSIIHYASVSDIEMIINELFEEIDEKVADCEEKKKQFPMLAEGIHGQISALLEMKIHLLDKQLEVKERYRP